MIEKILDKYYIKKIKQKIKKFMKYWISLNIRFIEEDNYIILQIKDEKFNDNEYKVILKFNKKEGIIYICMLEKIQENIIEEVKKYYKEINLWKKY